MAVLEASMTSQPHENVKKSSKNGQAVTKKVLLVAQELKLARVLAGNNKTARDRALKNLKKWFLNRSSTIPFTEDDFLRVWKGLFYSMWMSDKPLIQEECAESISNLVHALPVGSSLLFFKCGITVLLNEWFGIDQLRLDKFLMLVRRLLRQALFVLRNNNWSRGVIRTFTAFLEGTILDPNRKKPMGLLMHFIEIYLEELAKVSAGDLPLQLVTEFLRPFIKQLAFSDDPRIIDHIRKHIFIYLIRQSELGVEYEEKYQAWKQLGFPGSIDSMKKVEIPKEEVSNENKKNENLEDKQVFDPRAGRVSVYLPQIKFHSKSIAKALLEYKFSKVTNSKSRRCLNELAEHFRKMASGIYPLGVKRVKVAKDDYDMSIKKAVNRLIKFDQKIMGNKNKKKRKIENGDEPEVLLRNGKKIKLDNEFREKVDVELGNMVDENKRRTKKRRVTEMPESPLNKRPLLEFESVFERNSGTWFVTRTDFTETEKLVAVPIHKEPAKKLNTVETDLKIGRQQYLIHNPFASPDNSTPKKVKINTKLNSSQDVQEHHAQILNSPAIPYDANKKPTKPLLKAVAVKSPVNPFYSLYT